MNNADILKGIDGIELVIAIHDVTHPSMGSVTLVTIAKKQNVQTSYLVHDKSYKPKVNENLVAMILTLHNCGRDCYPNVEGFTKVVETNASSLDYDPNGILPKDARIYYIKIKPEQSFDQKASFLFPY